MDAISDVVICKITTGERLAFSVVVEFRLEELNTQ